MKRLCPPKRGDLSLLGLRSVLFVRLAPYSVFALTTGLALGGCEAVITTLASFEGGDAGGGSAGAFTGGAGGGALSGVGGQAGGGEGGAPVFSDTFEAEHGTLTGPLAVGQSDLAEGGAYLHATAPAEPADMPGEARAKYVFRVSESGDYIIWARIHSPGVSSNRFWFRVDEGTWYLWRVSTGEEWFWDDLHDNLTFGTPLVFPLSSGEHLLEVANAVTGAELDKFHVGLATDSPPSQEIQCNPPHSVLMGGSCVRSCGSYGNVTCGAEACAGRTEAVSYDCAICCLLD